MSTAHLKRVFVMPFFALLAVGAIHSLWRAVASGFALVWLGPLVVAGTFFGFMGWMVRSETARTSENVPLVIAVSGAGLALSLFGAAFGRTPSAAPLTHAVLAFGGVFLYVRSTCAGTRTSTAHRATP